MTDKSANNRAPTTYPYLITGVFFSFSIFARNFFFLPNYISLIQHPVEKHGHSDNVGRINCAQ